jgi:hypothetical protein
VLAELQLSEEKLVKWTGWDLNSTVLLTLHSCCLFRPIGTALESYC